MSGGHFSYMSVVETLVDDRDIFESGDIEIEKKASIIMFINMIINNFSKYESLLHEYDYFMSGDICETTFWKNVYRILKVEENEGCDTPRKDDEHPDENPNEFYRVSYTVLEPDTGECDWTKRRIYIEDKFSSYNKAMDYICKTPRFRYCDPMIEIVSFGHVFQELNIKCGEIEEYETWMKMKGV